MSLKQETILALEQANKVRQICIDLQEQLAIIEDDYQKRVQVIKNAEHLERDWKA